MIDLSNITQSDVILASVAAFIGALAVWVCPALWRFTRAGAEAIFAHLTSVEYRLSADVSDLESILTSRISAVEADVANLRASVASQTVAITRMSAAPAAPPVVATVAAGATASAT